MRACGFQDATRTTLALYFSLSTSRIALHHMDFFNIKARQAAAAQASSSKAPTTKQESSRLQPWVEK